MITYRKWSLRIAEYWDGEQANAQPADLIRWFQQAEPIPATLCRDFYTVLVDLRREDSQLLADMPRHTRYEIRRATERDDVSHIFHGGPDASLLRRFCDYYDRFAAQQQLPRVNRDWLRLLAEARALVLSHVADADGGDLVWHAYLRCKSRTTLLHSVSFFRNLATAAERARLGRANRYHHWLDMQSFKAIGISTYDFGGWYDGKSNAQKLRINSFKESFGGRVVRNYICEDARTAKARLFLRARSLLRGKAI